MKKYRLVRFCYKNLEILYIIDNFINEVKFLQTICDYNTKIVEIFIVY